MIQIFLVFRDKFKVLNRSKPVVLPILDGFGYLLGKENNAIAKADAPSWDELQMTLLSCSGSVVGLPSEQMGNSEVGPIHIGTGRYVPQGFTKVNDAIVDICNYANCDRVAHTGIIDAAVLAVEAVDASSQRIADILKSMSVQMLITADHGNIEQMIDRETGQPHTAHTTSVYAGGRLSDLASTVLAMLGVSQPVEITGLSLIKSV